MQNIQSKVFCKSYPSVYSSFKQPFFLGMRPDKMSFTCAAGAIGTGCPGLDEILDVIYIQDENASSMRANDQFIVSLEKKNCFEIYSPIPARTLHYYIRYNTPLQ